MFSLAGLRKIKEEGVHFNSHIDGHRDFHGTGGKYADSVQSQRSTIAMAFDECPPQSGRCGTMYRNQWSARRAGWRAARHEMAAPQCTAGYGQPGTAACLVSTRAAIYEDIRIEHAKSNQQNEPRRLCGRRSGSWRERMRKCTGFWMQYGSALAGGQADLSYGRRHTGRTSWKR